MEKKDTININIKIAICLTTIPSRIKYIEQTLKSLIEQTLKPNKIYLFLPKFSIKENKNYPDVNLSPEFQEIVEIFHPSSDFGPMTKFYPILELTSSPSSNRSAFAPDCKFIILDDDKAYHPNTIKSLIEASNFFPRDLIGFAGWRIGNPRPSWNFLRFADYVECDWLEGTNAILFPYETLSDKKEELLEKLTQFDRYGCMEARYCDDIWICAWWKELNHQQKILCVPLIPNDNYNDTDCDKAVNVKGRANHQVLSHQQINALARSCVDESTINIIVMDQDETNKQQRGKNDYDESSITIKSLLNNANIVKGRYKCFRRTFNVANYLRDNVFTHALRTKSSVFDQLPYQNENNKINKESVNVCTAGIIYFILLLLLLLILFIILISQHRQSSLHT
jgi:hypothetical protein